MTPATIRDLLDRLVADGDVDAAVVADAEAAITTETPWFVRGIVGGTAWVAGLLFTAFTALCFADALQPIAAPVGLVVLVLSIGLRWIPVPYVGDFVAQIALAGTVLGRGLVVWGLGVSVLDGTLVALIAIECVLLFAFPDRLGRAISAFLAPLWGWFLVGDHGFALHPERALALVSVAAVGLLLMRRRLEALPIVHDAAVPIAWGFGVFAISVGAWPDRAVRVVYTTLATAVAAGLVLRRGRVDGGAVLALAAPLAIGTFTASLPGLVLAGLFAALAFAARDRLMLAAAICGFVGLGVAFLVQIELSVAWKGLTMLAVGGTFLVLGAWASRPYVPDDEEEPA
jgi:hypothetical protein